MGLVEIDWAFWVVDEVIEDVVSALEFDFVIVLAGLDYFVEGGGVDAGDGNEKTGCE